MSDYSEEVYYPEGKEIDVDFRKQEKYMTYV